MRLLSDVLRQVGVSIPGLEPDPPSSIWVVLGMDPLSGILHYFGFHRGDRKDVRALGWKLADAKSDTIALGLFDPVAADFVDQIARWIDDVRIVDFSGAIDFLMGRVRQDRDKIGAELAKLRETIKTLEEMREVACQPSPFPLG